MAMASAVGGLVVFDADELENVSEEEAGSPSWGISARGIAAFVEQHEAEISEETTTSDVCHRLIKPATVPDGWCDEPTLVDPERRWWLFSAQWLLWSSPVFVPQCRQLISDSIWSEQVQAQTWSRTGNSRA